MGYALLFLYAENRNVNICLRHARRAARSRVLDSFRRGAPRQLNHTVKVETMVTTRGPIGFSRESEDVMFFTCELLASAVANDIECVAEVELLERRRDN